MITLDEVIDGYMLQNELPDGMQYRIEQLAIRGYRQLHYHAIGTPKTEIVKVSANNTCELPCDFLSKIRIGVNNDKGEITALVENNTLNLKSSKPSATLREGYGDGLYEDDINGFYDTYPGYGGSLGVGSLNNPGEYRIDYEYNTIILQPNFSHNEVVVEYLPIATDDASNYVVHPFFQEALISWLKWQDSVGRVKFSNERALNERDYNNAYLTAKRAMKPFNVGDYYNQWRQSVRSAVKA